jgi:hypothetical protein
MHRTLAMIGKKLFGDCYHMVEKYILAGNSTGTPYNERSDRLHIKIVRRIPGF